LSARFLGLRVATALGTLLFVVSFNFFLFRAVGDPKSDLARDPRLTPAAQEAIIRERGLDQDQLVQFRRYLGDLAHGDLGTSFATHRPVWEELRAALPNTLLLVGGATLLATGLGIWLGAVAARLRGSPADTALVQGSLILQSVPVFWLGMLLIYVVAVRLGWLPTGLRTTPGTTATGLGHAADVLKHAILPVCVLAAGLIAQYLLIMRASMVGVLRQDFVTTVRAIGMPMSRIRRRYVMRNSLLPIVTIIGLNAGFVVGGAITVEALFSWPGIGEQTFRAIAAKDYPMLQGVFLVTSAMVILANLVVDVLYVRLDPRVRER
jgi:peptide/nickel transport system permease protein